MEPAVFEVRQYSGCHFHQSEFSTLPGFGTDLEDERGPVWIRLEKPRLAQPPEVPERIREWVDVPNDPREEPVVHETRVIATGREGADALIASGAAKKSDVKTAKKSGGTVEITLRLDNHALTRRDVNAWLTGPWWLWTQAQKPRQRAAEVHAILAGVCSGEGVRVVMGVGVARWRRRDRVVDHPLVEHEVLVELEDTGAVVVRPAPDAFPVPALDPFYELEIPGTARAEERILAGLAEMEPGAFSPFRQEHLAPVLRASCKDLDPHARYLPDDSEQPASQGLMPPGDVLAVSGAWALYARRARPDAVRDLESLARTVRRGMDPPPPLSGPEEPLAGDETGSPGGLGLPLLFPLPSDGGQTEAALALDSTPAVVVETPPDSGATRLAANVTGHCLATGQRVLFCSTSDPAVRDFVSRLPETALAHVRAPGLSEPRTDDSSPPSASEKEHAGHVREVLRLEAARKRIRRIRRGLARRGLARVAPHRHMATFPVAEAALADLADSEEHAWLRDAVGAGPGHIPKFTDHDIAAAAQAREALGGYLTYPFPHLPPGSCLPDASTMAEVHQELVESRRLARTIEEHDLPLLRDWPQALERARRLEASVKRIAEHHAEAENEPWLDIVYLAAGKRNVNALDAAMLGTLLELMESVAARWEVVTGWSIHLPQDAAHDDQLLEAVSLLARGKRAYSRLPLRDRGKKHALAGIRIDGRKPGSAAEWSKVREAIVWIRDRKSLARHAEAVSAQLGVPSFVRHGAIVRDRLERMLEMADRARDTMVFHAKRVESEMPELFGVSRDEARGMVESAQGAMRAADLLRVNVAMRGLAAAREKLNGLHYGMAGCAGPIEEKIRDFLRNDLGNPDVETARVITGWKALAAELEHLQDLLPHVEILHRVAALVRESGAPLWADALRAQPPAGPGEDALCPPRWRKTWDRARRLAALRAMDPAEKDAGLVRELEEIKARLEEAKKAACDTGIRMHAARYSGDSAPRCVAVALDGLAEVANEEIGSFDLVILDQAESMDAALALSALVRGRRWLVLGDPRLPGPAGPAVSEAVVRDLAHAMLDTVAKAAAPLPGNSALSMVRAGGAPAFKLYEDHVTAPEIARATGTPASPVLAAGAGLPRPKLVLARAGKQGVTRAVVAEAAGALADPDLANATVGVVLLPGAGDSEAVRNAVEQAAGREAVEDGRLVVTDATGARSPGCDVLVAGLPPLAMGPMTTPAHHALLRAALAPARQRLIIVAPENMESMQEADIRVHAASMALSPGAKTHAGEHPVDESFGNPLAADLLSMLADKGLYAVRHPRIGSRRPDLAVEDGTGNRLAVFLSGYRGEGVEEHLQSLDAEAACLDLGVPVHRAWALHQALNPEDFRAALLRAVESAGVRAWSGTIPGAVAEQRPAAGGAKTFPAEKEAGPDVVEPGDRVLVALAGTPGRTYTVVAGDKAGTAEPSTLLDRVAGSVAGLAIFQQIRVAGQGREEDAVVLAIRKPARRRTARTARTARVD